MRKAILASSALALTIAAGAASAGQGPVPGGIPALDHVFVIMMENHAYAQISTNSQAPFVNGLMGSANLATKYYAIAHPSLTNYLEIVGGSNFNNYSDQYPDWHNASCTPNIKSGVLNIDTAGSYPTSTPTVVGPICPIAGRGSDADAPAVDETTNEGTPPMVTIDGTALVTHDSNIVGITIANQLVAAGKSWKSYQEGLPEGGADGVNVSDGFFIEGGVNAAGTNVSTDFSTLTTTGNPLSASDIVFLYAVKHNPFAYFASVQEGKDPALSLKHVVSFEGQKGLYADLKAGTIPDFAFIAPNQCDDMHGRGNGTAFCDFDATDDGTQNGLNNGLINQGDQSVERIVTAIKASSAWSNSKSAIVLVWDENDYSTSTTNNVVLIVDTNYGKHKVSSSKFYTSYSLTKTLDAAFGLPCLNHACDQGVKTMSDLFQE